MTITEEQHKALRAAFPPAAVGKLPKLTCKACTQRSCQEHRKAKCNVCGNYISTAHIDLDYVGHAEVTDRLLSIDPEWTWEPVAVGPDGGPLVRRQGTEATLWIRLTICGITRLGVGSVAASTFDAEKQLIGDALRNAAMRFGVALDLWSKNELESALVEEATPAPPADSPIDCPEACGHTAAKAAMRGHLLDAHGWQRTDDGRVIRPAPPGAGSTGPLPDNGAHDASPGVGTPEGGEAQGAPTAPPSGPNDLRSDKQNGMLLALCAKQGKGERQDRLDWASDTLGRFVPSFSTLTKREASALIKNLSEAEVPA